MNKLSKMNSGFYDPDDEEDDYLIDHIAILEHWLEEIEEMELEELDYLERNIMEATS